MNVEIAERLAARRKLAGLSQEALAGKPGVSGSLWSVTVIARIPRASARPHISSRVDFPSLE